MGFVYQFEGPHFYTWSNLTLVTFQGNRHHLLLTYRQSKLNQWFQSHPFRFLQQFQIYCFLLLLSSLYLALNFHGHVCYYCFIWVCFTYFRNLKEIQHHLSVKQAVKHLVSFHLVVESNLPSNHLISFTGQVRMESIHPLILISND